MMKNELGIGYLRPDGTKGIRNKVLVIYTVECSKHVAEEISRYFHSRGEDVDVIGSLACMANQSIVYRLLSYSIHPNVGAVVVIGHGCEYIEPEKIAEYASKHGRMADFFYLHKVGGTEAGIQKGIQIIEKMLQKLRSVPRVPVYIEDIVIGAKCGGSDFTSGIAGNVVIGTLFERLTGMGGTAMMEEMAEAIGLKEHLISHAVNADVAQEIAMTYDKTVEFCKKMGHYSISPGNFTGGLTTIEEKSMGAVAKMGDCKIEGVLKIAQHPAHAGFWILDVIPDYKVEPAFLAGGDTTGMLDQIACGCHIVLFNTGRGHVGGTPISPIIKLTGNIETYQALEHDIDLCVGGVLTGDETKEEAADRLYTKICDVVNGEPSMAERVGHRQGTLFFNYQDPGKVVPPCF